MIKGSDLFVAALANEGVDRVFGVPGEENLDMVESLRTSNIELVVTRHEQSAAFMAATHGRLTGRPGVCLSTLGPGALNLATGAAYAHLGAMPMILVTGQKAIRSSQQARFQIVDMVATMKPLTKFSRQIVSTSGIPTIVREAFRVATEERPGPVHLELPEDIAGEMGPAVPMVPPHTIELPVAAATAVDNGPSRMIRQAQRPLVMLGAAASRPRLGADLGEFLARTRIPFFTTQMGKGVVAGRPLGQPVDLWLGTAALSERDYVHEAIDRADLILAIGHDTVEKPPFLMGPGGPTVIHIGYTPPNIEEVYFPHASVVGDIGPSLTMLADRLEGDLPNASALLPLRDGILRAHLGRSRRRPLPDRAATHRRRRADGDAARRDRGPRQRHVQDLVRPQLPHAGVEHAAAGQRPGDDGSRPPLGDDGRADPPGPTRARRLRRRRLHDELPGAGDRGPARAEPGGADPAGQRLRDDPLEAGRRRVRRLRHDLRQPGLRVLRPRLRRPGGSRVESTEDLVPVLQSAFERGGVHLVVAPVDYSENTRVLVDELRNRVPTPADT